MGKFSFIPREEKFFDLFEHSAKTAVKIAQGLKEMINCWQNIKGNIDTTPRSVIAFGFKFKKEKNLTNGINTPSRNEIVLKYNF